MPLAAAAVMVAVMALVLGTQRTAPMFHEGTAMDDAAPLSVRPPAAAATTRTDAAPPAAAATTLDRQAIKAMLNQAAVKRGLNTGLVLALAWWESGWDQSQVSSTGAVGIMQVEPYTADRAGPQLLGRAVDIHQPVANIELGTAILKDNLDRYHGDLAKALAAYYAGPTVVTDMTHLEPDVRRYVLGIYRLAVAFDRGAGPA